MNGFFLVDVFVDSFEECLVNFECYSDCVGDYYGFGICMGVYFVWINVYFCYILFFFGIGFVVSVNIVFLLMLFVVLVKDSMCDYFL